MAAGAPRACTSREPNGSPVPVDEHRLNVTQMAARLGLSKDWYYRNWRRLGGVKLSRKAVRFPVTAVQRYLESHQPT
jgi:predicted DNA-binding transcriptional regulator AlpA